MNIITLCAKKQTIGLILQVAGFQGTCALKQGDV